MSGRFYEQVMGVYFDDLDAFFILHNARYLLLFERTLGSFWQELGFVGHAPDDPTATHEHTHLVRANSVEYLRPFRGTGKVRVRVWVERLGRSSMTIAFRMMPLDQDVDYAVGRRVVVRIDPDTYRAAPWTPAFRELIEPWVSEGGA